MRSRSEHALALILAVAALTVSRSPLAQQAAADVATERPSSLQVQKVLEKVAADPNLATERTVRSLRWAKRDDAEADTPAWLRWLFGLRRWFGGLFAFVAESGRLLLWVAGALLAALLVVYLWRLVGRRGLPRAPTPFAAPSHVRDLDIRPESLPDDVGGTARVLWGRGEQRAALALLYRGLLSRLVHVYGVPIRASSTEGDCLALAAPRLRGPAADYALRLVGLWQGAVYGAEAPAEPAVQSVCAEFGPALEPPVDVAVTAERA